MRQHSQLRHTPKSVGAIFLSLNIKVLILGADESVMLAKAVIIKILYVVYFSMEFVLEKLKK